MTWHLGPMAGFDIESGGTDVENHGVVTITVATVNGRNVDGWTGLIAVDFDIDLKATEVHHVTTEYAREHGKPAADVLDEAAGRLAASLTAGIPVVGMNLVFDFTLLDRDCRRHGVATVSDRLSGAPIAPVIDVLVIDKHLDRYRPGKRKLESLCEQYRVRHGGAHDALEDALAATRVAYRIGARSQQSMESLRNLYADRRFPERIARTWQSFARLSLLDLHQAQVTWYREQSESLGQYWAQERERALTAGRQDSPPPIDGLEDAPADELREAWLQQADELEARISSLSTEWPIKPLAGVR